MSTDTTPAAGTATLTGRAALTAVLAQEMRRSDRVLVMGETVRYIGAAGVPTGLHDEFGPDRVIETPVSENAIVGAALALSLEGFVPVVEIYSADFLLAVANEIINDIPKWRQQQRLAGPLPLVIRACMGANSGLGPEHSQSMEPYFHHAPGLTVVTPGTPADLAGLLRTSIRCGEPVLFLEHRRVYDLEAAVPTDPDHSVPLSSATTVREGTDATVVAWGWMRTEAERAAEHLAADGIDVELIDPRTISPMDWPAITASAQRTGALVVAEESPVTGSVAAEVIARVAEASAGSVRFARVCMPDVIHPYSAAMERHILPTADDICAATKRLLA